MNLEALILPLKVSSDSFVKQIQQATKEAGSLSGGLKTITENSALMGGVFTAVLTGVAAATKKGVDEFINYANQVREVMQVTGQTAEESSKLIQVLDDMKVSTDDMASAQKAFTKNGVDLTIDSLGKLSDEYRSLSSSTDKSAFMSEKFGKNWKSWVEVMGKGSVELNKLNAAQSGNLILTDRSIAQARLYEKTVDNLSDSWHGFWVNLGKNVVGAISDVTVAQERNRILIEQGNGSLVNRIRFDLEMTDAERKLALAAEAQAEANLLQGDTASEAERNLREESEALEAQKKALGELTAVNTAFIGVVKSVTDENNRYKETNAELIEQHALLVNEKDNLIKKGWWVESDAVKDVNAKLAENEAAMKQNTEDHQTWVNTKIWDLMLLKLSQDGLTDAEMEYYFQVGVELDLMTEKDRDMTLALIKSSDDRIAKFEREKNWLINNPLTTYHMDYYGGGAPASAGDEGLGGDVAVIYVDDSEYAGGGDKMASGGAVIAGQTYDVAEFSKPETFTATQSGRIDATKPQTVQFDESRLATIFGRVLGEQLARSG